MHASAVNYAGNDTLNMASSGAALCHTDQNKWEGSLWKMKAGDETERFPPRPETKQCKHLLWRSKPCPCLSGVLRLPEVCVPVDEAGLKGLPSLLALSPDAGVLQQSISHLIWVFCPSMEPVCLGACRIRMRLLPPPDKADISLTSFVSCLFLLFFSSFEGGE